MTGGRWDVNQIRQIVLFCIIIHSYVTTSATDHPREAEILEDIRRHVHISRCRVVISFVSNAWSLLGRF